LGNKYLIVGLPFSRNLGDRLINDSINFIFKEKGIELINYDLTESKVWDNETRLSMSNPKDNNKSHMAMKKEKKYIPNFLRTVKSYQIQKYRFKKSDIKKIISSVDKVIIGGGNLLIDDFLAFPSAMNFIAKEAIKQNKELHIFCIGANKNWSNTARKLFTSTLQMATTISTRDEISKVILLEKYPELENKIFLLSDPAIFSNDLLNNGVSEIRKCDSISTVGIGIMHPFETKKRTLKNYNYSNVADWWINLINYFLINGYKVNIFSNGSPNDDFFIEQYIKKKSTNFFNSQYVFCDYLKDSNELIKLISEFDIVIAQRLHACIPAIALNKPTGGVIWDVKVEANFNNLMIGKNLLNIDQEFNKSINVIENLKKVDNDILIAKKKEIITFIDNEIIRSR